MISFPAKKAFVVLLSTLGVGGLVAFGGNELSKTKVSDSLGEVKLLSESKNGTSAYPWYRLFSELEVGRKAKTEKFQKVLSFLKNYEDDEETSHFYSLILKGVKNLRKACEESREENYSSWFHTNEPLLEDVKTFCSIKISQTLTNDKLFKFSGNSFDSSEQQDWNTKITNLRSEINESVLEGLNPKLSDILGSNSSQVDSTNINSLFNWCKENLNEYYISDSDEKTITIKKYCTKTSTI